MTRSQLTLLNLFTGGEKKLSLEPHPQIEAAAAVARVKETLTAKAPALRWTSAKAEILDKLDALLHVDLATLMSRAWKNYAQLHAYTNPQKYPPDHTYLVPLAAHRIRSEHHPTLDILLNREKRGEIQFDLDISLTLKGFILKIQAGRIMAIHTGEIEGEVRLLCEEVLLVEKKSASLLLPDILDLGEGLPIG